MDGSYDLKKKQYDVPDASGYRESWYPDASCNLTSTNQSSRIVSCCSDWSKSSYMMCRDTMIHGTRRVRVHRYFENHRNLSLTEKLELSEVSSCYLWHWVECPPRSSLLAIEIPQELFPYFVDLVVWF